MKRSLLITLWMGMSIHAFGYLEYRIDPEYAKDSLQKVQADSAHIKELAAPRIFGAFSVIGSVASHVMFWNYFSMPFDPLPLIGVSFVVAVISGIAAFSIRKKLLRTTFKNHPNARRLRMGQWLAGIGIGISVLLIVMMFNL